MHPPLRRWDGRRQPLRTRNGASSELIDKKVGRRADFIPTSGDLRQAPSPSTRDHVEHVGPRAPVANEGAENCDVEHVFTGALENALCHRVRYLRQCPGQVRLRAAARTNGREMGSKQGLSAINWGVVRLISSFLVSGGISCPLHSLLPRCGGRSRSCSCAGSFRLPRSTGRPT